MYLNLCIHCFRLSAWTLFGFCFFRCTFLILILYLTKNLWAAHLVNCGWECLRASFLPVINIQRKEIFLPIFLILENSEYKSTWVFACFGFFFGIVRFFFKLHPSRTFWRILSLSCSHLQNNELSMLFTSEKVCCDISGSCCLASENLRRKPAFSWKE